MAAENLLVGESAVSYDQNGSTGRRLSADDSSSIPGSAGYEPGSTGFQINRPSSATSYSATPGPDRPFMRSRRRVRQRVDAGEPRNSYASIPGFSFRQSGGVGPNANGCSMR